MSDPTELARSFHQRISPLIRGITEATEEVSQRNENLTGRLRVTAPISFGTNYLGPVIAEFARRHPELEIAVDYEDRCVNLAQGGYDVGIRMGDLKETSLKARKPCDCARIVCCGPDYAANYGLEFAVPKTWMLARSVGITTRCPFPRQLIRILGCTSALIRSASHSRAARYGPCSDSW
jgi:DNA-binding transcriptional LysR family regulator